MGKLDITSLWIGDLVTLISDGSSGAFEGMIHDQAKIKVDGDMKLVDPKDLTRYVPQNEDESQDLDDIEVSVDASTRPTPPGRVVDLHLEKWPSYQSSSGISALDFQLKKCEEFLDSAIKHRYNSIVIIHGKGAGVLKAHVRQLLSTRQEIFQIQDTRNGGALEVIFHYWR